MKEYNSKKVNTSPVGQTESEGATDVDAVMKKYDRESNIRIWTGKYKLAIRGILIAFSLVYLCNTFCNIPGGDSTDFFPGTDRSDRISDLSCEEG